MGKSVPELHCILRCALNFVFVINNFKTFSTVLLQSTSNFAILKTNYFNSPKIEIEMLDIMSLQILRDIAEKIYSNLINSILVEETSDV